MPHNVDSMAYYGEPPWHGLGRRVLTRPNSAEMIVAAGLDWEVEMRAIANVNQLKASKPRKYQLIRLPGGPQEREVPLGVVSPRYKPLQNTEAFNFFDPIVGEKAAVFETAGALGNGERVWVLARVPGEIHVAKDDCCHKFLLLSNSHDGRGSVTVKFTPIRVVCQNTLMLALQSGAKAYTVRHSRNMQERLKDVQELLSIIWTTFEDAEALFRALVAVQVNAQRLKAYLEAVYPRKDEEREQDIRPARWLQVTELFEKGDAPKIPPSHTLWGAYNAVARYEDYRPAKEAGPDRRLNRVWFGPGAELKLQALQQAQTLSQQWVS